MLINLLASSNQGSYNISIAKTFGLECAVYIDVILNIIEKAERKNKVYDGYIFVDRDYVEKITTLDLEKQLEIDKRLQKVGILDKQADGKLKLDISELSTMIVSDSESLNKDIENIMQRVHRATRVTKEEIISEKLKSSIATKNEELRDAYYQWIDSVIAKDGWMSMTSVITGEQIVDSCSQRNLDIALGIVRTASINGYRDMNWAVSKFKENYNSYYNQVNNNDYVDYSNSKVVEVF